MNQEKIGKFISKLRKEKNMTQEQLAEILGVNSKSISRWENGRNMPDLSLLKLLCETLDVSINELLSGEEINNDEYQKKLEENIINTIDYTSEKITKTTKKYRFITTIFIVVVSLILILGILFGIDINRIKNKKPVFFSTWGFEYSPNIELDDEKIEIAIKDYIVKIGDSETKHHDNEKTFASIKIYLVNEKTSKKLYHVYTWVLEEKYYLENKKIKQDSGFSIPYKFVVEFIDNEYIVTASKTPRDGSYYSKDMEEIFPNSVRKKIDDAYTDSTIERLKLDIIEQTKLYYHQ